MTYSLSDAALDLLACEKLFSPDQIKEQRTIVPKEPGIYAWWFDEHFLPEQGFRTLTRDGKRLMYVGIAPKAPPKPVGAPRTLRDRLINHCAGSIATSTLRRSLAALLAQKLAFRFHAVPSGKIRLTAEGDEDRLTGWMTSHAKVAWIVTPVPWVLEHELLKHGEPRLPLNIQGSADPHAAVLKKLRADAIA